MKTVKLQKRSSFFLFSTNERKTRFEMQCVWPAFVCEAQIGLLKLSQPGSWRDGGWKWEGYWERKLDNNCWGCSLF